MKRGETDIHIYAGRKIRNEIEHLRRWAVKQGDRMTTKRKEPTAETCPRCGINKGFYYCPCENIIDINGGALSILVGGCFVVDASGVLPDENCVTLQIKDRNERLRLNLQLSANTARTLAAKIVDELEGMEHGLRRVTAKRRRA